MSFSRTLQSSAYSQKSNEFSISAIGFMIRFYLITHSLKGSAEAAFLLVKCCGVIGFLLNPSQYELGFMRHHTRNITIYK